MPYRAIARDYVLLWCVLVFSGLVLRPLIPVDETRAVSVAWEMWQRGDFLVPYLNGKPYSHKPPLLQWVIHLSWFVFGVNDWTPRFVGPLFGLGNLFLTERLARRLWPEADTVSRLAPLILLARSLVLVDDSDLYDMLVAFLPNWGVGDFTSRPGRVRYGLADDGRRHCGGVLSKAHPSADIAGRSVGALVVGAFPVQAGLMVRRYPGSYPVRYVDRPCMGDSGRNGWRGIRAGHLLEPISRAYRQLLRS